MKKVLVIEDDVPLCWLLEKILKNNYEVVIMNDGMEAWSWLSDGNLPNLIVSDLKMPSLDGIAQQNDVLCCRRVERLYNVNISERHAVCLQIRVDR